MHTPHTDDIYDDKYFMRGREHGLSLYKDYRWLPDLTIPMAKRMAEHCGFDKKDKILDFGCARGYLVKALLQNGYNAYGTDVSKWALENCDAEVRYRVSSQWPVKDIDWIIAKDVLEHIRMGDLLQVIARMMVNAKKGIFVVVPLSEHTDEAYVVPEYELDVTHVIRLPLWSWVKLFHLYAPDASWEISARYRIEGIKDNYAGWSKGNGFITCRRISSAS